MYFLQSRVAVPLLFLASFMGAQAQWSSNPALNNPICRAGNNQTAPKIVTDGNGGAIICWTDERFQQNSFDIYAQRIDRNGFVRWTVNGVVVSAGDNSQYEPDIAADGVGGAIIAWTDTRDGDNDVYAQRIDSTGKVLWAADGVPVIVNPANNDANPKLVSDGHEGAIITWNSNSGGFPPTSKIYAMRLDADGKQVWNAPSLLSGNLRFSNAPVIASDGSGGAYVAYSYFPRPEYDVYAQRVDATGRVLWQANGVGVAAGGGTQDSPVLVADGAGNAFFAYYDWGTGSTANVHVGTLKRDGSMAGTQRVTSTKGGQLNPQLAAIARGLLAVVWEDARNTGRTKVFAQIIDTTGAISLAADGVEVSSRAGDQVAPYPVSDGSGGVIVAWEDKTGGTLKTAIYAQRLSGGGAKQWTDAGVAVSTADNIRQFPRGISDGLGGAIFTWEDFRPSFSNVEVYASRILADGTFPIGPPALQFSAKSVAFGTVAVGKSSTRDITLTNGGGQPVTITDITSSDPRFTFTPQSSTIDPAGSVTATVEFRPTNKDDLNAIIVVQSNSFLGPDTVRVSGRGTASPGIETDLRFVNFGTVGVGSTRSLALNISNPGNDTLTISSIISSNPVFKVAVAAKVLEPGASFADTIRFTPTATGPVSGNLTITSNAPTSPTVIPLSGTGTTEVTLTIDPESISFGEVVGGSSVDTTVTLTNGGNDTLRISSFTSGDPAFTLESPVRNIAPGSAEMFTIRFTPSAPGPVSSAFTITSNAASSPHSISVSGIGVEEAGSSYTPSQLSFGDVGVGRQKDLVLMIRATGSQTLTVTGITSTNPDFTALVRQFEVLGGTAFEDTIRFAPSVFGSRSGMLIIESNAATSPDTVLVEGTGIDVSAVHELRSLPGAFTLYQNYPNPFHPSTTIRYDLDIAAPVRLTVYNAVGSAVATLVEGTQEPGVHAIQWNPAGRTPGVYFYVLRVGVQEAFGRMVLMR